MVQADGARRYQYNPRFQEIMREIPKGTIYDRNGLPLATSAWDELEKHRAEYRATGHRHRPRLLPHRHPPLSVGRPRRSTCWATCARASAGARANTSFVERDSATRLRGYDDRADAGGSEEPEDRARWSGVVRYDYRELVPLLRHRYEPDASGGAARARPPARCAHVHRCAPAGGSRAASCGNSCSEAGRTRAPWWCWIRRPATCWRR